MAASSWRERVGVAVAAVALGGLASAVMLPVAGFAGLMLYSALEPRMAADDLASFGLFFALFLGLGVPGLVVAAALLLRGQWPLVVVILVANAFVWSTLGFAGFWVGAMGI